MIEFQTYGEVMEQKVVVQNMLRCLTKKFSMVCYCFLEESKDMSNFTLEEVTTTLTNAFNTHASINRGRGRRGRGSHSTEDRTTHEQEMD